MDTPFLKPNRPLGYGLWVNMHIFCHIEKKKNDDDDDDDDIVLVFLSI